MLPPSSDSSSPIEYIARQNMVLLLDMACCRMIGSIESVLAEMRIAGVMLIRFVFPAAGRGLTRGEKRKGRRRIIRWPRSRDKSTDGYCNS